MMRGSYDPAKTDGVNGDGGVDSPTKASPLFDQVHDILWRKILNGEIQAGERLKDSEWAKKLGLSRTPVREAMRKMLQEGILRPLAHGGYEVHAASLADYRGLYKCRAAIDGFAALDVARTRPADGAAKLSAILEEGERALARGDLDAAFDINTRFHAALVESSGNAHLTQMARSIEKLILFYRSALLNKAKSDLASRDEYLTGLATVQSDHAEIVKAIGAGDGNRARDLVEQHMLEGVEDIAMRLEL